MSRGPYPRTEAYWRDLAYHYCSRRETSRARLKAYFLRKLRGFKLQEEEIPQHLGWIESVLDHCQQKGIIDHDRYAGILQRDLQRRNKGKRYVAQKMKERGLEEEFRKIDFEPEEELARAEALAAKTLDRGSIRKLEDQRKIRDKVLQKLLASGFEPGIAIKAADRVLRSR